MEPDELVLKRQMRLLPKLRDDDDFEEAVTIPDDMSLSWAAATLHEFQMDVRQQETRVVSAQGVLDQAKKRYAVAKERLGAPLREAMQNRGEAAMVVDAADDALVLTEKRKVALSQDGSDFVFGADWPELNDPALLENPLVAVRAREWLLMQQRRDQLAAIKAEVATRLRQMDEAIEHRQLYLKQPLLKWARENPVMKKGRPSKYALLPMDQAGWPDVTLRLAFPARAPNVEIRDFSLMQRHFVPDGCATDITVQVAGRKQGELNEETLFGFVPAHHELAKVVLNKVARQRADSDPVPGIEIVPQTDNLTIKEEV